ncbi:NAD-dependent epimerase/dehydratase family protein [Pseudonocardia sp. CA-107938]|uniref:NAD-dependent epimerase/dehydratase family protein n=1 Tax=Pseudonocardia sp. CA-107938 TaxID=3240021 RepID=UPI003D93092B
MVGTAFVTGGSGFVGGHLIERLVGAGWTVRALARSAAAASAVAARGAEPVRGDLASAESVRAGAAGAELAFHAAATVSEWAPRAEFVAGNVTGTANVIAGTRDAEVQRLVHVSTEAVLLNGRPLVRVDETAPLQPASPVPYVATKAMAEQLVRAADDGVFETVVVRPRLIWGPRDTTILPGLVDSIRRGRFTWIGGGRHLTATTHVANAVEGLIRAAEQGERGQVYFVTDGDPVEFRDFVTRLVSTAGHVPPARSLPASVAAPLASVAETVWSAARVTSTPPLTRLRYWLSAHECTIDISRARTDLGYTPVITRDDGLSALAQ